MNEVVEDAVISEQRPHFSDMTTRARSSSRAELIVCSVLLKPARNSGYLSPRSVAGWMKLNAGRVGQLLSATCPPFSGLTGLYCIYTAQHSAEW